MINEKWTIPNGLHSYGWGKSGLAFQFGFQFLIYTPKFKLGITQISLFV